MNRPDPAYATWRKSTYSGGGNNCVEVADLGAVVAVRDSKNPDGPALTLHRSQWTAFVRALKDSR
ncbi:DUF397 domain-containing protein [Thermomonospora catenispora]|uniref:DUF397 domain-containing protein n=1 Tax=Thermomonospora catenispora TaxID=2493090 RepID=UPI0011247331|nr:DUF397 domain-containing protein [Thermomonospora catenispora]TNY36550.1 DUF397 domain-containing protein [Thermomonospora catenispora]